MSQGPEPLSPREPPREAREEAGGASGGGDPSDGRGHAARLGTVIAGKWTLDALLGDGGLGAVYRARHKNGSRVAIKILHRERIHDRQWVGRFEREARLANKVDHPAVVRVLDDGKTDDACPYLVSELIEGENLEEAREAEGGVLPWEDVLAVADVLLAVLEVAHEKGVLHRDIKPANVMRTPDGELRVLDFGLAREAGETRDGHTSYDAILGTVGYMAPEQAQGRWDLVDATTDLWSVAATILKLATGLDVHEADTPQTRLALAATRPAPPLASRGTTIEPAFATVIDRALAFTKSDRYRTAAAFRAALARATRGESEAKIPRASTAIDAPSSSLPPPSMGGPHASVPPESGSRGTPGATRSPSSPSSPRGTPSSPVVRLDPAATGYEATLAMSSREMVGTAPHAVVSLPPSRRRAPVLLIVGFVLLVAGIALGITRARRSADPAIASGPHGGDPLSSSSLHATASPPSSPSVADSAPPAAATGTAPSERPGSERAGAGAKIGRRVSGPPHAVTPSSASSAPPPVASPPAPTHEPAPARSTNGAGDPLDRRR